MLVDQHRMVVEDVIVHLDFKLIQQIIELVLVRRNHFCLKNLIKYYCYIDVNECEIWDECDQDCQNTIGSYVENYFYE